MRRTLIAVGVLASICFGVHGLQAATGWLVTTHGVGFVAKVDVSNLAASTKWYVEKLGLVPSPKFKTKTWQQLDIPGFACDFSIGLNVGTKVGTGGATATFIVKDILVEQAKLKKMGVNISDVTNVGEGVCLAFFSDPDLNQLGLRQNGCKHPPYKAGT
jgi:catechol 2,3-dioxygenase-like lactoylglutathione lyase family enzyme